MKLTFEKLSYKNIMSVGAKPIEIDFTSHKKILVTGKNGGGKSTMLEALCFALFGKPFRDIKKSQLVNCINKKNLLVELVFNDGKNQFKITRGIKPNKFEILKNGVEIEESASVKEFQSYFETDILKMNMQSFKQTIILGTAGYVPFMSLTAANRRSLIEDLINLTVYSDMDGINKSVIKEITQQMTGLEIKLTGMRNEYDAHMQHINKQKQMSDEFIQQLRNSYQTHVDGAKLIKTTIMDLSQKVADMVIGEDYSETINRCIKASSAVSSQMSMITSNLEFFMNNDSCPTCKQHISDAHKNPIINELSNNRDEMQLKLDKVKQTHDNHLELQKKFIEVNNELRKLKMEIEQNKQMLTREVNSAKIVESNIEQALQKVDIDTSRVDVLTSEMAELRKQKTEFFEELYARKIVMSMLKDSGIKSVIMKRYIPIINKKINGYLKTLGADYTFTLDQEFNESIKSRGREDFSYTSFSQGEKARIDLSLLFTWRDVASIVSGTEINLLILDEVSDSATDAEGVAAIHKIIDNMTATVMIISHREEHDANLFNKRIRMVKRGRFTTME